MKQSCGGRTRRGFLQNIGLRAAMLASGTASFPASAAPPFAALAQPTQNSDSNKTRPNIVVLMTDQQRADLCARENWPLDVTPFLDRFAGENVWFNRAYTSMPVCAPARVSLFTGRWPGATRVRTNHNLADAVYEEDLIDVLRAAGYVCGMSGKNHSHLRPDRMDLWFDLGHDGARDVPEEMKDFYAWMKALKHGASFEPTPFPVAMQGPVRATSKAMEWIESPERGDAPFFLWLTFAEPHNPYQAPEPYFSMFPPESLPEPLAGPEDAPAKGFKWEWNLKTFREAMPDHDEQVRRARANYHGMLRLIDDQAKRFIGFLDERGLRENTIFVFLSDHGDFVGEYGLMRKGPELPELLVRIPMIFAGPGVRRHGGPRSECVSIVDVMPTLCEAVGVAIPDGVQGRSLWPMLTGGAFPAEEFESAYCEHGFGGLYYGPEDDLDPQSEGAINDGCTYDCLNSWTQSGQMRSIRKGDWKLTMDMQGVGALYHLAEDPRELENRFGRPEDREIQTDLLADLMAWTLRAQDPLPRPRSRYVPKTDPRNWLAPHRASKPEP